MAPEHRASLQLKRDEIWLWGDRAVCSQLDFLAAVPYVDLVDENDVVLSHKWVMVTRLFISSRLSVGVLRIVRSSVPASQGST